MKDEMRFHGVCQYGNEEGALIYFSGNLCIIKLKNNKSRSFGLTLRKCPICRIQFSFYLEQVYIISLKPLTAQ